MSRILLASMLVFALGVARVGAQAGDEPPAQPRTTTIVRLNHLSAIEFRQLLQLVATNNMQIAAEPISNSLLISATAADRMEIERLIAELDRPQAQVAIEVEIAQVSWFDSGKSAGETPVGNRADAELDLSKPGPELVARLRQMEQKGLVEVLNRINLSAVSNQPAMVQMGDRRAVPRGVGSSAAARAAFEQQQASGSRGSFGGSPSSVIMSEQSMGTLLNATPRVAPDGTIALQIDLEKSFLNPRPDDAVISGETRATGTSTAVLKSTVVLRSGETAVLGGFSNSSKPGQSQLVVLVTARIEKNGTKGGD